METDEAAKQAEAAKKTRTFVAETDDIFDFSSMKKVNEDAGKAAGTKSDQKPAPTGAAGK